MHLVALQEDDITTLDTMRMPTPPRGVPSPFEELRTMTEDAITYALVEYLSEHAAWPSCIQVGIFAYWALGCPLTWWVDDGVYLPIEPSVNIVREVALLP